MHTKLKIVLGVAGIVLGTQAAAQITFYEGEGFRGQVFTTNQTVNDFERRGFNDRASSAVVGSGRWEVCDDAQFGGNCVVLRQGSYGSLGELNNRVSSARPVSSSARYSNATEPAPIPAPTYAYRQRPNERLYQANVTGVRAVVGPPEQRCWVEREQVVQQRNDPNIPGAVIGGILGGVLGHQIGGGRGQDVATGLGAVGGAVVGANVGRDGGSQTYSQNVQRCATVQGSARPDYWDVTYDFRGQQHRVQMAAPPGQTVTVNGNGEPRG
jgi:uncharacterized protein YcfJ